MSWRLVTFRSSGRLGRLGAYYYYPLKVATDGKIIAVVDGAPNLRVRNSRVLIFDVRTRKLVASSLIPRGTRRFARGHGVFIDVTGRILVAVQDSGRTHLLRLTRDPKSSRYEQAWDTVRGGRYPTGIHNDDKGTITLVDGGNHRIIRLKWKGDDPLVIGSSRELHFPRAIVVDRKGNLYTQTTQKQRVHLVKYDPQGKLLFSRPLAALKDPLAWFYNDMLLDLRGRLLITDYSRSRVLIFDRGGKQLGEIRHRLFKGPMGLAIDPQERLYVADAWAKRVFVFRPVYAHELKSVKKPAPRPSGRGKKRR